MKKTIYDVKTGEETIVDLTPEEVAEREKAIAQAEAERLAKEQAEAEKQANLESAKAKLTALGLDEAEVQAILGL
jgi:fido (protein-threonine AMPylation protein)